MPAPWKCRQNKQLNPFCFNRDEAPVGRWTGYPYSVAFAWVGVTGT